MNGRKKALINELLVLFIVGFLHIGVSYFLLKDLGSRPAIVSLFFFIIGLSFEFLTKDYWTYQNICLRIPGIKADISYVLPVGWSGMLSLCFSLTLFLEARVFHFSWIPLPFIPSVIYLVFPGPVITFIYCNLLETIFHKINLFQYTETFYEKYGRRKVPWGLPLPVALGYFYFFGIVLFAILRIILWKMPQ